MVTGEVARKFENKSRPCLQEGQEGRSGELGGQPLLDPWEGDRATNSEKHLQTHERQAGDWEQSAQIDEGEVIFNQLDSLLQ